VAAALESGTGDFVADVACELPLQAISEPDRRPAGGPGQDLRLVQPDDRLRRRASARTTACASLAKLEIELIFNAIADAMPDIAKAGDPVRLRSGWINGIKSLPVTYRPLK
jgi:hypothetical protein